MKNDFNKLNLSERFGKIDSGHSSLALNGSGEATLQTIMIDELTEHPYESYIYGEERDYEAIKGSIERNGYMGNPIIVSHREGRYIIVSGHSRVSAYKDLGQKSIPCQVYENLTEEQENDLLIDCNASRYRDGRDNDMIRARELDFKYKNYCKKAKASGEKPLRIDLFAKEHFGYSSKGTYRLMELLGVVEELQELVKDDTISARSLDGVSHYTEGEQKELARQLTEIKEKSEDDTVPLSAVEQIKEELRPGQFAKQEKTEEPEELPESAWDDEPEMMPEEKEPEKKKKASHAIKQIRKLYDIMNNLDDYENAVDIVEELKTLKGFIEDEYF